jgi:peptide/nickel transport system substrate-binding protein
LTGSKVRRVAVLLAVVLVACGSLVGCGVNRASSADGPVLTFATGADPGCLDPQVSGFDLTALIDRNMFDSLVHLAPDGRFEPWLARQWTVSGDGTVYTFSLRDDVTFHDGTPVDAAAVKATFDHAVDPRTRSMYAAGLIHGYTGAKVVDEHTVEIRLARPDSAFLQAISTPYLGIQSPRSFADPDGPCQRPVGSGPFRFASRTINQTIELKRNPGYDWAPASAAHSGPARLGGITIKFIVEDTVRVGALVSGQLDVVSNVPPAKIGTLKEASELRVVRTEAPGAAYTLYFNTGKGSLTDERIRVALLRSVDVDGLVKAVYFGHYRRAWSVLSPATLGYDATIEGTWPLDTELADRMLDQAGWTGRDAQGYRAKDGRRLTVRWPYMPRYNREQRDILGQGIQAQAKRVGIDLQREALDPGNYVTELRSGQIDVWDSSTVRADPDILRTLFASDQTNTGGGFNVFRLADPRIDQWFASAATAVSVEDRKSQYVGVQRYLIDHAMVLPCYVPTSLVAMSAKVRGLTFDATAFPLFYGVSIAE